MLKSLESPLDWKEIKPVNPKGNQIWIFIGKTDAEAEASAEAHFMVLLSSSLLLVFFFLLLEDENEKAGLQLNIQKTKIMASGLITSWQIDGETMETVSDFNFWAPKSLQMVTAAMKLKDAYSLEGKLWPT